MRYSLIVLVVLCAVSKRVQAQMPTDSTRTIIILPGSRSLRQLQIDSITTLITLAGNASVKQGNTIISGDSISVNQATGVAEVFGNVHINDADSVQTYAQYLKYLGKDRIAYLKRKVKLTDGRGILYTDDLTYNLATGIANYKNGGRVVNGSTVLTSANAEYYADTKDVYFKQYVHLVDPKYDIVADSLRYNTQRKEAQFISPTRIKNKDGGVINTKNGFYNLETGQSEFYDQTAISDSNYFVTGKNIAYNDKEGVLQIENNGKIVDSANNITMLGNLLYLNKKNKTFLGTKKPIMIVYRGNDSTYITADTLYSGVQRRLSKASNKITVDSTSADSTTLKIISSTQDTVRYMLGFHNVRIFNDSLQAVSDSMYYSTEDSVFRLYRKPVFWNDKTQVSGDTMYLFTEKQQAKRLYVFNNSIVINNPNEDIYNQIGGRTLNTYFSEGNIDYIRVRGAPAESVFYPQDDDSAYIGMNRSSGDIIDVYFINKELNKVKFINKVDGTLFPLRLRTTDNKYLKNFLWQDKRRPKNKLELFE